MSILFSELRINEKIILPNRIVFPPIATEKANDDGSITDEIVSYYGEIAKLGMGLLIVEHCAVLPEGRTNLKQITIARDSDIEGHKRIAEAVHGANTIIAVQINHAGSNRSNAFTPPPVAPSPVPHPNTQIIPQELTISQISEIIKAFGDAAKRGKVAGYDMVEIHSAHGFLGSQFLSPLTNRRNDNYGGQIENRMRFLLEVIEEVKGKVGKDYPVLVRLGISDNPPGVKIFENGLTLEEGLKVAKALEKNGISILDISGGMCGSRPKEVQHLQGYFVPFAEAAKEVTNLPIIITGGIKMAEFAEKILKAQSADLIGVGRTLISDKNWIERAKSHLD